MSRVLLAMSGGVDSSVAAHLLLEAGHEVIGVFMRHGEASPAMECETAAALLPVVSAGAGHKQGCCSASDAADARRVADALDLPFYALNLQREFGRIIDYFVDEYTRGRTPNPCVACNHWIKFGKLFDYADSLDAEFVATGHYARLTTSVVDRSAIQRTDRGVINDYGPALRRGKDARKDQTYALFGIDRRMLPRMMLPVGEYEKPQIRRRAARLGFDVAEKKDSQEICFVSAGRHGEFVRNKSGNDTSGELVTTDGSVVGRHEGIERVTIGQRKGLGVAFGEPRFVVRIEPETRRVVIGEKEDLARRELTADKTNWLTDVPAAPFRCLAQIRYNSTATPAVAETLPGDRLRVTFDEPAHGVAPGQAVVLYDDDRVLGGGWIE